MRHPLRAVPPAVALVCLSFLLLSPPAPAQSDIVNRVGNIFDSIADYLKRAGEKSEDYVKSPFDPWNAVRTADGAGLIAVARAFDEPYPVRPGSTVTVSNEFGEIRIEAWKDKAVQVVQVTADISVGAETAESAHQISRAIDIHVTPQQNGVTIRTLLPDTREMGRTNIEVNYVLTVPADANVIAQNLFGDTVIHGVGGSVAAQSAYGVVDLRNLSGPVSVRARGESLAAANLAAGGAFELTGCQAEFGAVSGPLKVVNFMGAVTLRNLAATADIDVTNASGPVYLYLGSGETPDLECEVLFGGINSHIPLDQSARDELMFGRSRNVESKQRLRLRTSFDNIHIYQEGRETTPPPPIAGHATDLFEGVVDRVTPIAEGVELIVDAIAGKIEVVGVDDDRVHIKTTKRVRLASAANAAAALEALDVAVESLDSRVEVQTRVRDDMVALGCSYYRVDLLIRCPRTTPVKVRAQNGDTIVRDMGETVVVEQGQGRIIVEHSKSRLDLTNQQGDVQVTNCAGPVTIKATRGAVSTQSIYGKQEISCTEGRTFVDAPLEGLVIRQRGGDARIIALEGVGGDYDVLAERGNISIVLSPDADAKFFVSATDGVIASSAVELQGSIGGRSREFTGRMHGGRHTITLETREGDIIID